MLAQIFGLKALVIAALLMTLVGFASPASAQYEGDAVDVIGGIGYDPEHDPANGANTGDGEYQDPSNVNQISYEQAETVTRALYRAVLFREGEDAGVEYWMDLILRSPGTEGLLHAARGFAESEEFRNHILPQYSDQEILENIYSVFFNRSMDSSGAHTWGDLFRQARHADALRGIVGSEEFAADFLRY